MGKRTKGFNPFLGLDWPTSGKNIYGSGFPQMESPRPREREKVRVVYVEREPRRKKVRYVRPASAGRIVRETTRSTTRSSREIVATGGQVLKGLASVVRGAPKAVGRTIRRIDESRQSRVREMEERKRAVAERRDIKGVPTGEDKNE